MPPWWVYHGRERSDQHLAVSQDSHFVGAVPDVLKSHIATTSSLKLTLSGACYRTARRGRASIFTVLVSFHHFACLSCRSPGRRPEFHGCRC